MTGVTRLPTSWVMFVVVLVTTWELGTQQQMRYRPPRLMPADDQVTLEPGDILRVRCEGHSPVTWRYSSLAQPPEPGMVIGPRSLTPVVDISRRVKITDNLEPNSANPYVSQLEIRDVSYLDVGYQSCLFVGTDSLDIVQNVTQVYLFVNDPKHLLVKSSALQFLTVTQNMEAVLPCRPSHPEVKVSLHKDGQEITDLAARSMIYRRTEGFIIHSPVLTFHNGDFLCKASFEGATDRLQIFTVFNPSTDTVQQPWISSRDADNAVLGGNFTLECRVHHQPGMFHTLTWNIPDASTGMKASDVTKRPDRTGRIVQYDQEVEGTGGAIPGARAPTPADLRRLLVQDVRVEDEGYYTCHVQDQNGHTNERREFVTVHDSKEASVELTTDTTQFVTQAGKRVKIVVNIEAHPAADVVWYDPAGTEIQSKPLKYSVEDLGDQTVLQIFDLSLQDMGKYRVVASSMDGNATDSLNFDVEVQDAPQVLLRAEREYYPVNSRPTLACEVSGWPSPTISWEFAYCPTREGCQRRPFQPVESFQANGETEARRRIAKWKVNSTLTVDARQSGYYRCSASNKLFPDASATAAFYVSDVADGFGILPRPTSVVVGDRVNLTCAGSKFAFDGTDRLSWFWSATGVRTPTLVTDAEDVRVVSRETEHSYQRVLVLLDIQPDRSGRYLCSGDNLRGGNNRSDTLITVRGSAIPRFTPEANMDESATVTFDEGTRGELNCTVTGLPPPAVTWTKDGAQLNLDENGRVQLSPDGQRLIISAAISDDAGNYECRAENRVGFLLGSAVVQVPGSKGNTGVIIGVTVVMVLILIALAACLVWKIRQQKNLQQRLTQTEIEAFTHGRMNQFNPNMAIDEQAELLPYDEEWEFPKDKLILGRQIGSGAFGRVLKAEAVDLEDYEPRTTVAVKMPKSGSDPNQIRSMMAELKIMIQLGKHLNVVNLLGAVTKDAEQGEFMVMVEYCRHGNLHQYLQRHKTCFVNQVDPVTGEYDANLGEEEYEAALLRGQPVNENTPLNYVNAGAAARLTMASESSYYKRPRRTHSNASSVHSDTFNTDGTTAEVCSSPAVTGGEDSMGVPRLNTGVSFRPRRTPLTTRDLLRWSYQVARGMEYLASRKLLHGDLAARNILLAENNIVKISDFGLSRDIYKTRDYKKKGKGLLPVKWMAIESIQESIFSTQSDVWAFGVVMWEFFSLGASPYPGMEYDINFVRRLRDGYRMEMPKYSPQSAYKLMLDCWSGVPSARPSFTECSEKIGHFLEERIMQEYHLLNEPYKDMNDQYFAKRTDYVSQLVSPDYQNVTGRLESPGTPPPSYVNLDPRQQRAGFTANGGGANTGSGPEDVKTGADGYLLMTPEPSGGPGPTPDNIFSPRPTAVVRPQSHFPFPDSPAPPPPTQHFNPSYDETAKVPSTPKMGTRASRTSRPPVAPKPQQKPAEDQDNYLVPTDFGSAV